MPRRSKARRNPSSDWKLETTGHDRNGHRMDTFRLGSHKADLHYLEEDDVDGDIIIVQVNGYWLESDVEDAIRYKNENSALAGASKGAKLFDDRRVRRFPARGEDWEPYLEWFETQSPNQADYVILLQTNDPNGSYDNLLMAPLSEAKEVFEETFSEYQSNPRDFDHPEPVEDDEDDEEDEDESLESLAGRYYHPAYEQFGEPNPREVWVVVAPLNKNLWPVGPLQVVTHAEAVNLVVHGRTNHGKSFVALRSGFESEGQARSYADKVEHAIIEVSRPSDGTVVYRGSLLGFSDDPASSSLKFVDRERVIKLADSNVESKLGQGKKALIGRRDRSENPKRASSSRDAIFIPEDRDAEQRFLRIMKDGGVFTTVDRTPIEHERHRRVLRFDADRIIDAGGRVRSAAQVIFDDPNQRGVLWAPDRSLRGQKPRWFMQYVDHIGKLEPWHPIEPLEAAEFAFAGDTFDDEADQWLVAVLRGTNSNPYMGDAVELAKQRKYEEQRRRWEKEGRRGPPPAPPRNPSDDEPPAKRKPRKSSKKIYGYVDDGILYDTTDHPTKWGVSEYLGSRGGRTWYLLTMYQGGEEVGFLLGSQGSEGVFEGYEERSRKTAMKVFDSQARQKNPREFKLARRIAGQS